jgi:hypothetical protein
MEILIKTPLHLHLADHSHACLIMRGKNFNLSCNQFAQDNRTQSGRTDGSPVLAGKPPPIRDRAATDGNCGRRIC